MDHAEKNYFALRRGPYLIAHVMEDSSDRPFCAEGTFVDLADAHLKILHGICLQPGEDLLAADLSRYGERICLVGSAGRVEDYRADADGCAMLVKAPDGSRCALRFKCPEPSGVAAEGASWEYDAASGTLLAEFPGRASGVPLAIRF